MRLSAQYSRRAPPQREQSALRRRRRAPGLPECQGCPSIKDKMPIDDRDDRRTPSNAPEELVMDLLAALQAADYTKAQPLIEKVLKYEPTNELMLEYRAVVQRALKRADDHAEDDAASVASSSTASSDDSASSASSTSSSDAEEDAKPTTISTEELREDLAAVGLRGTADELRANVGYIRRAVEKKPPPKVKADALDFLECK